MELYSLQVFLTVAVEKSFSRAAEKLLRTQPAVSLAVQRLEQELGEKLIDRSGKDLIPLANAGPLKSDFEAVQQAAESGNGDCSATEAALTKTREDFGALPASVDADGVALAAIQGLNEVVREQREAIEKLEARNRESDSGVF